MPIHRAFKIQMSYLEEVMISPGHHPHSSEAPSTTNSNIRRIGITCSMFFSTQLYIIQIMCPSIYIYILYTYLYIHIYIHTYIPNYRLCDHPEVLEEEPVAGLAVESWPKGDGEQTEHLGTPQPPFLFPCLGFRL